MSSWWPTVPIVAGAVIEGVVALLLVWLAYQGPPGEPPIWSLRERARRSVGIAIVGIGFAWLALGESSLDSGLVRNIGAVLIVLLAIPSLWFLVDVIRGRR